MKKFAIGFLLLVWCTGAVGQAPLVKQWDKRYGGTKDEYLTGPLLQSVDGGFYMGGSSNSGVSGDKSEPSQGTFDYWMVKTDFSGIKEWDKRFGGSAYDEAGALLQTPDGGFIFSGTSMSDSSGDRSQPTRGGGDYWVVKTDSMGNKQWDKRFGGSANDLLNSVLINSDGTYILMGISKSGAGGDKTQSGWGAFDLWVIKIDALGNKLWDKRYGGTDEDYYGGIIATSDGGYLLGSRSRSGIGGDKTHANWDATLQTEDYWIVKIDSAGNKQWDKCYGGDKKDWMMLGTTTSDGGFILRGFSYSGISGNKTQANRDITNSTSDIWLVKIDSVGNKQWDKRYGGDKEENAPGNIMQTVDKGYLIAGASFSGISGDKSENNMGAQQAWVIKTDSLGNKLWDKTIFTNGSDGAAGIVPTYDGCFMVGTYTTAGAGGFKTQTNWDTTNVTSDCWVVKLCDTSQQCNLAPIIITTNNQLFCASSNTQLCAPVGFNSYNWNNGATTRCISTSFAGNYYVTVTNSNGCSAVSSRLSVSSYPQPPVSISVSGDTLTVYNAVTQQWYLNGSVINGATSNIYIATQGGSYTVMVTDSNGCAATSSPVLVSGIENISEGDVVSVYQLPVAGWQLTAGNNFIGGIAEVYDANGRVVFQQLITNHQSLITPEISRGVYLLLVSSSKSSVVLKLVRM